MKNILHRLIALWAVLMVPMFVSAQSPGTHLFWEDTIGRLVLIIAALVLLSALVSVNRLFSAVRKMEQRRILQEQGIEPADEPDESWWQRFVKAATQAVPVSQEQDVVLEHEYDGIRELDNRLPPWWLWMFYASIIFSVLYYLVLHVFAAAPSLEEEYEKNMETAQAAVAAYKATQADNVDENNVVALLDAESINHGKDIFAANCVPCHGSMGEGNTIGPNLTDEYWLHGGSIGNIFGTISNGVIEKGMQSWKEMLRPVEIQQVSSYILSLQGTNPPNAKAPQGELWKPESTENSATPPADSTATGDMGDQKSANENADKASDE